MKWCSYGTDKCVTFFFVRTTEHLAHRRRVTRVTTAHTLMICYPAKLCSEPSG